LRFFTFKYHVFCYSKQHGRQYKIINPMEPNKMYYSQQINNKKLTISKNIFVFVLMILCTTQGVCKTQRSDVDISRERQREARKKEAVKLQLENDIKTMQSEAATTVRNELKRLNITKPVMWQIKLKSDAPQDLYDYGVKSTERRDYEIISCR